MCIHGDSRETSWLPLVIPTVAYATCASCANQGVKVSVCDRGLKSDKHQRGKYRKNVHPPFAQTLPRHLWACIPYTRQRSRRTSHHGEYLLCWTWKNVQFTVLSGYMHMYVLGPDSYGETPLATNVDLLPACRHPRVRELKRSECGPTNNTFWGGNSVSAVYTLAR